MNVFGSILLGAIVGGLATFAGLGIGDTGFWSIMALMLVAMVMFGARP